MSSNWSATTDRSTAARRAGGRRRYHSHRQLLAEVRRSEVARLLERFRWPDWGAESKIARMLRVNRSTVNRDIKFILGHMHRRR